VIEHLSSYAPELNPIEMLWGWVKGQELANLCADTIDEVAVVTEPQSVVQRRRPRCSNRSFATVVKSCEVEYFNVQRSVGVVGVLD
jgi:transposase